MREDAAHATILVVDDERPLLRLLTRVLEGQGYTVLTAIDCDEAIDVFDKHVDVIDCAVLDVVIPPSGIAEVMDHIVSARNDLAMILSSGDIPDPEISARLKAQGGSFLRKPFLPKALLDLVATTIEAKRQARDLVRQHARHSLAREGPGRDSGPNENQG